MQYRLDDLGTLLHRERVSRVATAVSGVVLVLANQLWLLLAQRVLNENVWYGLRLDDE